MSLEGCSCRPSTARRPDHLPVVVLRASVESLDRLARRRTGPRRSSRPSPFRSTAANTLSGIVAAKGSEFGLFVAEPDAAARRARRRSGRAPPLLSRSAVRSRNEPTSSPVEKSAQRTRSEISQASPSVGKPLHQAVLAQGDQVHDAVVVHVGGRQRQVLARASGGRPCFRNTARAARWRRRAACPVRRGRRRRARRRCRSPPRRRPARLPLRETASRP